MANVSASPNGGAAVPVAPTGVLMGVFGAAVGLPAATLGVAVGVEVFAGFGVVVDVLVGLGVVVAEADATAPACSSSPPFPPSPGSMIKTSTATRMTAPMPTAANA
jgi:hypothetical protein